MQKIKELWSKISNAVKNWWEKGKPTLKNAMKLFVDAIIKPAIVKVLKEKKQQIISEIQNFPEEQNAEKWGNEIKQLIDRQV